MECFGHGRRASGRSMRAVGAFLAALALIVAMAPGVRAATPTIRISTDNTASHVQTRVLRLFAERLEERLGGRVTVKVHDSATLFRDRDVIEAVAAGRVDMAAPGMWHLDRYVPDFAVFLLPMFYGLEHAVNYAVRDGEIGAILNQRLESVTGVRVLGRWIDLGEAHLFTRGVTCDGPEDIKGMRLRVAGGKGNAARIRALGAEPACHCLAGSACCSDLGSCRRNADQRGHHCQRQLVGARNRRRLFGSSVLCSVCSHRIASALGAPAR